MTGSYVAQPRPSALPRDKAMRLAATEYQRFAAAVAELGPQDWARRTDCPAWNVHEMVAHVVGMAYMVTSRRENGRQRKGALTRRTEGVPFIDWLTAYQVERFGPNPPAELARLAAVVAPKAARGRKRVPGFVRRRSMPLPQLVGAVPEQWTLGFLIDTVLTRDTWMHRVDLARATGQPMVLTAEHDGAIIADVVAEWAERHGAPYRLTLTGPAGGIWSSGSAAAGTVGEELTLDAVEFCRLVSGRGTATGLLTTAVPF
ncbi:MAG: maleylpyruvate isomerase family mycothiol-dependent enzyme [Actinomycetales bacterium]